MALFPWRRAKQPAAPNTPANPTAHVTPHEQEEDASDDMEIAPEAATSLVRQGGATVCVIDVREAWEHDQRRVVGATLIPLGQFAARLADVKKLAEGSSCVLIHCEHGIRSLSATALALEAGIAQSKSVRGGMAEWAESLGDLVRIGPPDRN